jgi:hypothetical protein
LNYQVGQILYVILKKEASVYPMQVVEEITKKTLNGEETSYILRAGADANKTLNINEIDGEVFDSAEVAKKVLVDRVSQAITTRVDQAIAKAKEWYPSGFEHASDDPLSLIKKTQLMTAADQAVAPKPVKRPPAQLKPETAQLAAELQQEADAVMMEVPDGNGGIQQVKVKGVKLPPTLS